MFPSPSGSNALDVCGNRCRGMNLEGYKRHGVVELEGQVYTCIMWGLGDEPRGL